MKNSFQNLCVGSMYASQWAAKGVELWTTTIDNSAAKIQQVEAGMKSGTMTQQEAFKLTGEVDNALKVQAAQNEATTQKVLAVAPTPQAVAAYQAERGVLQQGHDTAVAGVTQQAASNMIILGDYTQELSNSKVRWNAEMASQQELPVEVVKSLVADLDHKSGVERTNRGFFTRLFKGGSDQKFIVGEAQLQTAMASMSQQQLDNLSLKLIGDPTALHFKTPQDPGRTLNYSDLSKDEQTKLQNFQNRLLDEVATMSQVLQIIYQDPNIQTGLYTVLNGQDVYSIQAKLSNPDVQARLQEALKNEETLNRNPNIAEKVAGLLIRIGISASVAVASTGVLSAYTQSTDLTKLSEEASDGKNPSRVRTNLAGLDASVGTGLNSELKGSLDVAGARLGFAWNSPEQRIRSIMPALSSAQTSQDFAKMVGQIEEGYQKNTQMKEGELAQIKALGQEFLKRQDTILQVPGGTPEAEAARKRALNDNNLYYLAKIEQIKGWQLEGVYGNLGLAGWSVGLFGGKTEVSYSSDKARLASADVEAALNGGRVMSEAEVNKTLQEAGVVIDPKDGTIRYKWELVKGHNGQPLVVQPDEVVQWDFKEILTDRDKTIRVGIRDIVKRSELVGKTETGSTMTTLRIDNPTYHDAYIDANQQAVANFMFRRKDVAWYSPIERAISAGKYEDAANQLDAFLTAQQSSKVNKDAASRETAKQLQDRLKEVRGDKQQLTQYMDLLLGLSSGSQTSRDVQASLEQNGQLSDSDVNTLNKYYGRVIGGFQSRYHLNAAEAKELGNPIKRVTENKDYSISNLGSHAPNGFVALVAYSQDNKGADFKQVDRVDHANARIVGTPEAVSDGVAQKIRQEMIKNIPDSAVENWKQGLLQFYSNNRYAQTQIEELFQTNGTQKMKEMMVAWPVKSYLSFEPYAGCFNLGFFAEPGSVNLRWEKTTEGRSVPVMYTQWSIVGSQRVSHGEFGFAVGQQWKKPEKKPNEPDTPTTTPRPDPQPNPTTPPSNPTPTPTPNVSTTPGGTFWAGNVNQVANAARSATDTATRSTLSNIGGAWAGAVAWWATSMDW